MKSTLSKRIMEKYYRPEDHPFHIFERRVSACLPKNGTVVDAGCGAGAPLLRKFSGGDNALIGVDLVEFTPEVTGKGLRLLNNDLARMEIEDSSVDLVYSRSVMEHLQDVESVYREINRILRPGGRFLFLVPNLWDYVSIVSSMVPNRFHKAIVAKLTGRDEADTFPTYYRSNTGRSIRSLAARSRFDVLSIDYYGQYPYMLEFNGCLFGLGVLYDKFISRYEQLGFLRGWIMAELGKAK